jgi:hypothetical protein
MSVSTALKSAYLYNMEQKLPNPAFYFAWVIVTIQLGTFKIHTKQLYLHCSITLIAQG